MYNSLNELKILSLLHIRGKASKAPTILSVIWRPPPTSWIKANTDGSTLGSPGILRAPSIFRTTSGFPRGAFAFFLGNSFAYIAEINAAMCAVEIAWQKGWHSLWLETDSSLVFQLFTDRSKVVPWHL